jgi:hypothetical protein
MIKTFDPEITITKNGVPTLATGDWDSLCLESIGFYGKRIWNSVPIQIPWFKKFPLETWRHYADPGCFFTPKAVVEDNDPEEYLRLMISLIGLDVVANMDHSLTYVTGSFSPQFSGKPAKPGSHSKQLPSLADSPFWKCQQAMADWASPEGRPSLVESYTRVDPAPLNPVEWGYLLTNAERDILYLHIIKNPWGKTGFPKDNVLLLNLPEIKVIEAFWMNQGKVVDFEQQRGKCKINLQKVLEDPVDTVLRLKLDSPLSLITKTPQITDITSRVITVLPIGSQKNLALQKPSVLLDVTGKVPKGPSSNRFSFQGNDGLLTTSTAAGYAWAWTYEVDMESLNSIRRVVVHFEMEGFPTEYKILCSADHKNWTEIAQATANKGGRYEFNVEKVDSRYIQVQSLKPDGPDQVGFQMSIAELEVYSE